MDRGKKPVGDIEETEMTPRAEALEQAAARAMAQLRDRQRLVDLTPSLPSLSSVPPETAPGAPANALGDDPALWSRAQQPGDDAGDAPAEKRGLLGLLKRKRR